MSDLTYAPPVDGEGTVADRTRGGNPAPLPRRVERGAIGLVLVALAMILGGSLLAWWTQTAGGTVSVRDVRWVTPAGVEMSALLYVPDGVDAANPAPGIVAIHGYINSRETQSGFAIEFARRGFVVLAADQTGHGYSSPPAMAHGFGGPDALAYLRSLDFVDPDDIGLSGHSMGGWASGHAATALPDGYRSMVLVGSSTGSAGVQPGTPLWPRNVAIVWGRWDEFSASMWGSPIPREIGRTEKLMALFGTREEVVPGRIYGSVEEGTARRLYLPRTNHPGEHLSGEAIGNAVEWFQLTLDGGSDLPPGDQIWFRKEIGTLLAAAGMILLLVGMGALLLGTRFFSSLRRDPSPSRGATGPGWWVAAGITAVLGPLTLFPFKDLPSTLEWRPGPLFPQSITNAVVAWTTGLALVTLALFLVWHFATNRGRGATMDDYGLTWEGRLDPRRLGSSLLLAFAVALSGYVALAAAAAVFIVDFRFWVFAVKPMSLLHLRMALVYFVPFALFFLALNLALYGQLRRNRASLARDTWAHVSVLVAGWVAFHLYQYVPLLAGGTMSIPDEPLWTIVAYQLLPLMTIAGILLAFFNRRTASIYPGAFLTAMVVTWIVVASQATHVAL
jgi:pimeloyl-ACP methyl ester carboxylesterase